MWRPDNWDETKPKKFFEEASIEAGFQIESNHFRLGVEAGGDAMLEALTSQKHQDWLATSEGEACNGKWVFIPEEEDK